MKFLQLITHPGFDKCIRVCVLLACLLALSGIAFYCLHANKNPDGISMIVTSLISVALQITGFDWGSSAGSKTKDDLLHKIVMKTGDQPTNPSENQ